MSQNIQKPDRVIANTGTLAGAIRDAIEKWMRNEFDGFLPAQVVSYNRSTNRATIKPLVQIGTTDGTRISRPTIENVKVFRFGGGGAFISFDLQPGDFGWIKSCDRDISLVLQSRGGEDWPNTKRIHSFSDSMFYPDTVKDWVISSRDSNRAVLQSINGNSVVAIGSDVVEARVGNSTALSLTETSASMAVGNASITVQNGSISLAVGNQSFTIGNSGVSHDGTNVGKDHAHGGSPTAPDGPVTNTGTPI